MSVSGNMGESSMSRPPKPHPMSANSTLGEEAVALEGDGMSGAEEEEEAEAGEGK